MYDEADLLPISALQHLIFCERQCALIHIEGLWSENRLTVEGRHLHDKAHDAGHESRGGVRLARAVPLVSRRLGLTGVADVVEFHDLPAGTMCDRRGNWEGLNKHDVIVIPVEYKRGRPKRDDSDHVQLAAQALALEEMLGVPVERGVLFYGRTRRRIDVPIDDRIRNVAFETADRLHEMVQSGCTPAAELAPKCKRCSLFNLCLPHAAGRSSVERWFGRALKRMLASPPIDEFDE